MLHFTCGSCNHLDAKGISLPIYRFVVMLAQLAEAAKAQFSRDYSNHLALVRAYEGWKEARRDVAGYEYCWKDFFSTQSTRAVDALQRESYSSLKEYVLNCKAR
ncbi:hypothetical protein LOK49_LG12G01781 [Camellia lanceoleosa]|uniref:Uncharacterized protein n=1 Tax=Camellia lanceoleosa TaxID=1840588 RepID=A0ACC0FSV1_9ERIC|nr:hypothetical protein LOK49_LG12G01781 [Camellia lanceoleosa]